MVREGPPRESSNDDKLIIYGLYKQATEGDARAGDKPGMMYAYTEAGYKWCVCGCALRRRWLRKRAYAARLGAVHVFLCVACCRSSTGLLGTRFARDVGADGQLRLLAHTCSFGWIGCFTECRHDEGGRHAGVHRQDQLDAIKPCAPRAAAPELLGPCQVDVRYCAVDKP